MHCETDFDAPAAPAEEDGARGAATADRTTSSATPESVDEYGTTGDGYDGDHPLDGVARVLSLVLTVLLGLAATVTVTIAFAQRMSIWLPLALLALAGTAVLVVHVWRFPTGRGALARSLYLDAAGLVVVPVTFGLLGDTDDSVVVGLIFGISFGAIGLLVAVPVALLGYWLAPDRV